MAFGNMYNQPNYYGNLNQVPQNTANASVYFVNSAQEGANFPCGFGTTVLISLNDNVMYIKNNQSIQAYKLALQEPPKPAGINPVEDRLTALESNFNKFMEQFGNFMNSNKNIQSQPQQQVPQQQIPQQQQNPSPNNWDV